MIIKRRGIICFFLLIGSYLCSLIFIRTQIFASQLNIVSANEVMDEKEEPDGESIEAKDTKADAIKEDKKEYTVSEIVKGVKPTVSGNYFVNGVARSIRYRLEINDGITLSEKPYSYDGGINWTSDNEFIVSTNGDTVIYIKDAEDTEHRFCFTEGKIDRTGPKIAGINYIFPIASNGYGTSVTAELIIEDEGGAGLDIEPVAFYEDNYTSKLSRTYYSNGEYEIHLKDALGNISSEIVTIDKIDDEPPVIIDAGVTMSVSVNGFYTGAEAYVDAYDAAGGLAADAYSFDGGASFLSINHMDVKEDGVLNIIVKDAFGHMSYRDIVVSGIDSKMPVLDDASLSLEALSNGYGSRGVLSIKAHDNESGLATEPYSYDGGNTYTDKDSLEVTENGLIKVCIKDNAGNVLAESFNIEQIDKTGPVISITGNPEKATKNAIIKVTARDDNSGIESIWYKGLSNRKVKLKSGGGIGALSDSIAVNENGTYTFFAYDCAGNESIKTVKVTKIEKDAGSLPLPEYGAAPKERIESGVGTTVLKSVKEYTDDTEEPISTSIYLKNLDDESNTEEEITETEPEEIEPEFKEVPFLIKDEAGEEYKPSGNVTEIASADTNNLTKGGERKLSINYPDKEEEADDKKGDVVEIAIVISLFLLALISFVLYKLGVINKEKVMARLKKLEGVKK